jgi:hypothetical protein
VQVNSELSRALINKSGEITEMGYAAMSESKGGDSFCHVTMGTVRSIERLVPIVGRKGQYPPSDEAITVADLVP